MPTAAVVSPVRILVLPQPDAAVLDRVAAYVAGPDACAAVVVDPTPIPARTRLIEDLARRRKIRILRNVRPNPRVADINTMAAELAADPPDIVIGIGGGSTLDSAKGLALLLDGGGDLHDYLGSAPRRRPSKRKTRLILIPTTAGTGSEVTRFAVYTTGSGRKVTLNSPALPADAALLCPPLTYTMPPSLTAVTGMDALSHALETLWNRNADDTAVLVAHDAACEVLENIQTAFQSARTGAETVAGRAEMLEAACAAGVAFNRTGTAAVHALSFILSEEWHLPHGAACAFFLDEVLRINARAPAVRQRLVRLARRALGSPELREDEAVAALARRICELRTSFGLPANFRDIGAGGSLDELVQTFSRAFDDPKMNNNPVRFDDALLAEVLAGKQ